jgi:hypothetical protein
MGLTTASPFEGRETLILAFQPSAASVQNTNLLLNHSLPRCNQVEARVPSVSNSNNKSCLPVLFHLALPRKTSSSDPSCLFFWLQLLPHNPRCHVFAGFSPLQFEPPHLFFFLPWLHNHPKRTLEALLSLT